MYSYIPISLNQFLNVRVDQWFQICIMDTCQWVYVLIKGLFSKLFHFFISLNATVAWYPAETDICALFTQQPEQVHDMTNKGVLGVFTFNCLQTRHWVRVHYYIVMNWTHVSVIVQCQSDDCSLSSKDGAIVWQSCGQLAAGCLTISRSVPGLTADFLAIFWAVDELFASCIVVHCLVYVSN